MNQMDYNGGTPDILKNIISDTAKNALAITALYKVAFDRLPDLEGLNWWLNDMANGQSFTQVAHSFAPHLPVFGYGNTPAIIDQFSMNAFGHVASVDVQNHWQIMALNALPSYELVKSMALELLGQPIDSWAYPVL